MTSAARLVAMEVVSDDRGRTYAERAFDPNYDWGLPRLQDKTAPSYRSHIQKRQQRARFVLVSLISLHGSRTGGLISNGVPFSEVMDEIQHIVLDETSAKQH